jgi:hypothetical protein
MKQLIAIACLSVIALTAYYFYGEYQSYQMKIELSTQRQLNLQRKKFDDCVEIVRQFNEARNANKTLVAGEIGAAKDCRKFIESVVN